MWETPSKNFAYEICSLKGDWTATSFIDEQIEIRTKVGSDKVLCALSGELTLRLLRL